MNPIALGGRFSITLLEFPHSGTVHVQRSPVPLVAFAIGFLIPSTGYAQSDQADAMAIVMEARANPTTINTARSAAVMAAVVADAANGALAAATSAAIAAEHDDPGGATDAAAKAALESASATATAAGKTVLLANAAEVAIVDKTNADARAAQPTASPPTKWYVVWNSQNYSCHEAPETPSAYMLRIDRYDPVDGRQMTSAERPGANNSSVVDIRYRNKLYTFWSDPDVCRADRLVKSPGERAEDPYNF